MVRLGVSKKRTWSSVVALLGASILLASTVSAQSNAGSVSEQVTGFRAQLEQLALEDNGKTAQDEIRRAQRWLDEAEAHATRNDRAAVENRLRRVDHTIDLIQALVQVGNIEHAVLQQEARYDEIRAEIESLETEIKELEERKARREGELRNIRD